jgi:hypothetical protein
MYFFYFGLEKKRKQNIKYLDLSLYIYVIYLDERKKIINIDQTNFINHDDVKCIF